MNSDTIEGNWKELMVYNLIEMNKSVIENCQFVKNEAQVYRRCRE